MAGRTKVGIIGCGVISEHYLRLAPLFRNLEIVAGSDILPEASKRRSEEYKIRDVTVDELLKDDEVSVVLNLTPPTEHFKVMMSILSAGKHAFSEKPLGVSSKQANKLLAEAEKRGLQIGCAPDTFLGAGGQTARRLLDEGVIGKVVAGSAHVLSHGMEHWHPNPGFFYEPGAGPMFDVGPYYIVTLVNLLGPVKTVAAMAKSGSPHRLVTAEGPFKNKKIKVTTPTTLNAVLEFHSGAQVTMGTSWDIWKHGHGNPIELYGSEGSMLVPDPNFFGGKIHHSRRSGDYVEISTSAMTFGAENYQGRVGTVLRPNYRSLGLADMVDAIARKRTPRCNGRFAAHAVEVMEAVLVSAETRKFVNIKSKVDRPKPLTAADAQRLLE